MYSAIAMGAVLGAPHDFLYRAALAISVFFPDFARRFKRCGHPIASIDDESLACCHIGYMFHKISVAGYLFFAGEVVGDECAVRLHSDAVDG